MSPGADTVTLDREAVIEAAAWLLAASDVLVLLNNKSDHAMVELLQDAGHNLRKAAFGEPGPSDKEYACDPAVVEIEARSSEYVARLFDTIEEPAALDVIFASNELRSVRSEAKRYRAHAENVREADSAGVKFPGLLEVR